MSAPPIMARIPYDRSGFGETRRKHGATAGRKKTAMYSLWMGMRARCMNTSHPSYPMYGGRGVKVCKEWDDFAVFLAEMGERPSPTHTLDRYPNMNGNYCASNCRWATRAEQSRNRRSNRQVIRSDGIIFNTIAEAAESVGGFRKTLRDVLIGLRPYYKEFGWSYAP